MVSFAVQKILSLIRSHLFIFISILFPSLKEMDQKNIAVIYVRVFCLYFTVRVL